MIEALQPFAPTIWALMFIGGLLLMQLLIADAAGLVSGHVPGTAVVSSHESFHFRATRAHANTNESIASFILLTFTGIAVGVEHQWLNWLSITYCVSRFAHMGFYLIGWGALRSVSFGLSLLALFGILIVDVMVAF